MAKRLVICIVVYVTACTVVGSTIDGDGPARFSRGKSARWAWEWPVRCRVGGCTACSGFREDARGASLANSMAARQPRVLLELRGGGGDDSSVRRDRERKSSGKEGGGLSKKSFRDKDKEKRRSSSRMVEKKDGLEWRRGEETAEELVRQADEGRFDQDIMEVAKDYMDSEELENWDELYEGGSSSKEPDSDEAPRELAIGSSGDESDEQNGDRGGGGGDHDGSSSCIDGDGDMELSGSINDEQEPGLKRSRRGHKGKDRVKGIQITPTRPSGARQVQFSETPSPVHRYPHGNQEWFTADEISELTSEEEEAMERQLKNPRDSSSFVEEDLWRKAEKAELKAEKAEEAKYRAEFEKYKERMKRETIKERAAGTRPSLFKSEAEMEREKAFKPVVERYKAKKEERRLLRESRDQAKKARLKELAAEEKKKWRPPTKRPDTTGIFNESVTWKEKIRMLRLAKKEAWSGKKTYSGTLSAFTLRLLDWEKRIGLVEIPGEDRGAMAANTSPRSRRSSREDTTSSSVHARQVRLGKKGK